MPNAGRDPICSVKAFLQGQSAAAPASPSGGTLAGDLDLIRERLTRARQVDGRVSPSEALEALLSSGEPRPA
jgi:hypothetical protein